MVKTNIQTFTGEVEILSNLHVGPSGSSYLTANGAASNVLDITGNVGATFFVGDGGFLSNIATTLSDIVNQGNVSANVLQFNSTSDYAGVGLVTSSNVGIQNTAPSHTLSIGDKIRVDDNTVETSGQSVIQVDGRILATRFQGDGGLLSNIATTFESIVNQGNVASNVVKFSSDSAYAGAGVITDSNVGIQNTAPTHNLSVGSNLHVNDTGSNVLTVHGNVVASNLNLGVFSIVPAYGLNDVCNTSNGTSNVVQFQNATTSLIANSNIVVSGNVTALQLISTANTEVGDRLKFSGSNVFVDTLRVADVAANIVTYDRTTGELLDSSGTFMNKFAVVSEQPPSDLFANATTVTNHGGYTLTTSNLATNSNTYNAFDGTANAWVSGDLAGGYIGGANVFLETNLTQLSNLHPTQFGDWLAIEFPYKTTLRHMKLTPLTAAQFPASANIYATNNDLTWTEVNYWSGRDPVTASNVQTITVNATEQFKKYALVATKAAGNSSNVALQDWQLFTESFSIDGGKVAMAQQAATGGETVMDQHGPHGRLPTEVPLKKYPEIAFESGKFDSNDSTNTYVQAGYTVSASGKFSGSFTVWTMFDESEDSEGSSGNWIDSPNTTYAKESADAYGGLVGNVLSTVHTTNTLKLASNTPVGAWFTIELPNSIKLHNIQMRPRSADVDIANQSFPKEFGIWGYDGNVWTLIKSVTGHQANYQTLGQPNYTTTNVNATTLYKKYGFVITRTNAVGGSNTDDRNFVAIGALKLYGYEEDPPLGDTSVDTTFTSIMNTPQTTGAQVYVDGSLGGNANTNRVVGPAAANTAATYDTTGKYWELNGTLTSNISVEANTFLEGDAPHSVSVWFNSSNLVSNASNSCIFSLGTEERLDHVSAAFSNNYQTVQKLLSSDLEANDRFGDYVAMNSDGTRVIVGAYLENAGGTSDAGAAYIYTYNSGTSNWDEQKLVSPDNEASAQFGTSVDMNSDGTKVIVGAMFDDEGATDTGAAYIFTYSGGSWDTGTKIVAPDKQQADRYGVSVGMSGNGTKVIVGAYIEDPDNLSSAGSAYIYAYDGSNWDTGTKIVASDREASDIFGRSVAINSDGTKVIVGADGGDSSTTNDTGAAYIFTYSGGSWDTGTKIQASDNEAGDKFGFDVAMSGDGTKVIVGSYLEDPGGTSDAGAAYIFTYSGGSWDTGTKIVAPDKEADDYFGRAVGMSSDGTRVIVGANQEDPGGISAAGSAYIYAYDGSNWDTGTKIVAPDKAASDNFGYQVDINSDGTKVIVGAYLADPNTLGNAGAAYIYTRDTTHHLTTDLKLQSNTWHNLTYAYQGEGGSRVTYLDGRKVAEDQAEDTFGDYPPFAMTGYSQGGYCVSESSMYSSSYPGWKVFDDTVQTSWESTPQGSSVPYATSSPGSGSSFGYATNANAAITTLGDSSTVPGEWIQMKFPHKISVNSVAIMPQTTLYTRMPGIAVFLGSNSGNDDWVTLATVSKEGATFAEAVYSSFIVNATMAYSYIRIIWKTLHTQSSSGLGRAGADEIKIYGHRENDLVRLPDPTNVLKYPHIIINEQAKRGYVVSQSSQQVPPSTTGSYQAFNIFDGNLVFDGGSGAAHSRGGAWITEGVYDSSGNPTGSGVASTNVTGQSPVATPGEWFQLELPHKVKLSSIRVMGNTENATRLADRSPVDAVLAGSNDGTTWTTVLTYTGASWTTLNEFKSFPANVDSTNAYKYFRFIITKNGGQSNAALQEFEFYGTEENSSIPIQIGGGNIDKVANFRVYDKFVGEDQALEIWDAQKDEFGRAKSSMTLQKGRLGIGTTEPEGRLAVLDEPHNLEEFPPRAMTGHKTYMEGHGEFCVSASDEHSSNYDVQNAFNKITNRLNSSGGATNTYYNGGEPTPRYYDVGNDYAYSGTSSIHGLGDVMGEWVKLEFPYKANISQISILPVDVQISTLAPEDFTIMGSSDDINWTTLRTVTGATWTAHKFNEYTLPSTTSYKYFALVVSRTVGSNQLSIQEVKYFGTREQGQSVLHDGQLTLTKNLNVPRIGPALDADDTPRRDRLFVEYNTSTNPTFEGAVRDTSGRGNDGVFYGGASYDATDKALVFDGTTSDQYVHTRKNGRSESGDLNYTVSLWFNPTTVNISRWRAIFVIGTLDRTQPTDNNGDEISMYVKSGGNVLHLQNGGSSFETTDTLTPGRWVHIVLTYDGTNRKIYLDGSLSVSHGYSALNLPKEMLIRLAQSTPNGNTEQDEYMDCKISNFKAWFGASLTAEEVKTLYDMGRCDEGHHMVNFSKTRVGIGLGDGEAPRGDLDVRGDIKIKNIQKNFAINTNSDIGNVDLFLKCSADTFTGGGGMTIQTGSGNKYWRMIGSDYLSLGRLAFGYSTNNTSWADKGYLNPGSGNVQLNFTGQHRTFIKDVSFSQAGDLEGLIVSSDQNKYIKMSGGIEAGSNAITTNESLPIVSLSNVVTDKKCFGVISASEDPETREEIYGNFGSVFEKEKGDTRVYINSVGEGAIWVSNIGGNLESGDYITTSNVAGYGQKQTDDVLHNYTVAKITMDCDFNPATQPIQQILRSNVVETYYLGNVHKVKSVPHEFVTTTVGADDTWSNVSVKPSDVTYAEWSNLEANTQNTYTLTYTQTSNVVYDTKYTLTTTANVTESDPWDSVFVDPPDVTYAEYSNLEANTQSSYSLTFTKTTTDTKTPEEWSALESNIQSLYNMVYYQSVEEEVASDYPGATTHTRVTDVIENELDAHGQIQWEDHATETEKAYKIRYLDVSGAQTDEANAVHVAAFVGCTYHCG